MPLTREQIERHTRLAHRLDSEIQERRFWVSIGLDQDEDGRDDEAFAALSTNVQKWLESLTPWGDSWSEREFDLAGWHLTVRAYPKGDAALARGGSIIANPFPAYAYWVGGS